MGSEMCIRDRFCKACLHGKARYRRHARKSREQIEEGRPTRFGLQVTADHMVLKRDLQPPKGEARAHIEGNLLPDQEQFRYALVLKDRATGFLGFYPNAKRNTAACVEAYNDFRGSNHVRRLYSDNAPELIAAAKRMGWQSHTSTPGDPQNSSEAERTVGIIKDAIRTNLNPVSYTHLTLPTICSV